MSRATNDKLEKQLHELKTVDRPNIIEEIAEARSNGDLSENAEYHAAREKQGEIEAHIRILEDKLARAEIIEVSAEDSDHVIFGATVKVKDLKTQKEMSYTLVSPDGVDLLEGKISAQSPIGKGLMGKKVGEVTQIQTPKGELELEILEFH
jgi:transcription elongation factor GreA